MLQNFWIHNVTTFAVVVLGLGAEARLCLFFSRANTCIALKLETLEKFTYSCPWENTLSGKYNPISFKVWPWDLLMVLTAPYGAGRPFKVDMCVYVLGRRVRDQSRQSGRAGNL